MSVADDPCLIVICGLRTIGRHAEAGTSRSGQTTHRGPEHQVCLRIGERDGAVYIDLGDAQWRAIEVTAGEWRVIDQAPVKFIRSAAMRALPLPEDGGVIEQELRDLVNVRDEGVVSQFECNRQDCHSGAAHRAEPGIQEHQPFRGFQGSVFLDSGFAGYARAPE